MDAIRLMTSFVHVARSGSFTAAAEALGVSPSLISKQIAALEARLGAQLLNRTTRRVGITDIGQEYYERCQKILADIEAAEHDVGRQHRSPQGRLRIRAPHSLAFMHMGALISGFSRRYPDILVHLIIDEAPKQSVDMLQRGYDLSLHLGPVETTGLTVRKLAEIVWLPFASPEYLRLHGPIITPATLESRNCLLHLSIAADGTWEFAGPGGPVTVRVSGSFAANSALMLRDAALEGVGVALLPAFCCAREAADGRLVRVLTDYAGPERGLSVAYPAQRLLPRRVRLFIDFCVDWFAAPSWASLQVGASPQSAAACPPPQSASD